MPLFGNPYYHHPQLAARLAADDVLYRISHTPLWKALFEQGKMLGVLVVQPRPESNSQESNTRTDKNKTPSRVHYLNNLTYLAAYSGVVNGFSDNQSFFVPAIYDLQRPDDFYLQKDAEITAINGKIAEIEGMTPADKAQKKLLDKRRESLRTQRKEMSIALQREIFAHFTFCDQNKQYRNIIDIFADANRGLPPGGSGECAAPRLLQYAYQHNLEPIELAEFWYGRSPRQILRIHGQFYPSCIEKCSPILSYMLPQSPAPLPISSPTDPDIQKLYEDEYLIVINKPKGLLSVPSKDLTAVNVETMLHQRYPQVKGPMLVHRLDQATSGVMIAAKDGKTYKLLQEQFEQKTIHKRYIATLKGKLHSRCGMICLPLTVNPDDRPRQVVDWQFGKPAVTYYEVIRYEADATIVAFYPLTGRTHQLRVHAASRFGLDSPIVGDTLYDDDNNNRCLRLHAESITFIHPATGESMTIQSEG